MPPSASGTEGKLGSPPAMRHRAPASTATSQARRDVIVGDSDALRGALHSVAERLEAANNYLATLQAALGNPVVAGNSPMLAEKTARQLDLAIAEFRRLRDQLLKL